MKSKSCSNSTQPQRLYASASDLAERFAVGRTAIWGWLRTDPSFPKPIKLSPGTTRWKLAEIEAWEMKQIKAIQS